MNDVTPETLPAIADEPRDLATIGGALPPSLQILLDDRLYNRLKNVASLMSNDHVFTPKHLQGKPAACFTVLTQALDWKMNPTFVARSTYETPGGSIGFEGKLVQGILEQSGRLQGGIRFEHVGDWSKVIGKFEKRTSQKGREFMVPTWTAKDAEGLGVIVRARVRGENEDRVWPAEDRPFYLTQCFPLNSPLWASDASSQICYLAVRRFANMAMPGILGGMPFDHDEFLDASERARDVTPVTMQEAGATASRSESTATTDIEDEEAEPWTVYTIVGEAVEFQSAETAVNACQRVFETAPADKLALALENNQGFLDRLLAEGMIGDCDMLIEVHAGLVAKHTPPEEAETTDEAGDADDGQGEIAEGDTPPEGSRVDPPTAQPATAPAATGTSPAPTATASQNSPADPGPTATTAASHSDAPGSAADRMAKRLTDKAKPDHAAALQAMAPTGGDQRQSPERHDPYWDGESLELKPDVIKGAPVWKNWILKAAPRLRQVWSAQILEAWLAENTVKIKLYGEAMGDAQAQQLQRMVDEARARVGG